MRAFRFSLRNLIIVITLLAVLLAVVPAVHRWYVWAPHQKSLYEWDAGLKRLPNKGEAQSIQLSSGQYLTVSTTELEFADDYSSATFNGQPVRDRGYFVVPPGKWVDTTPEAIRVWQKHSR